MPVHFHWPAVALAAVIGLAVHWLWTAPFALGVVWTQVDGWEPGEQRAGFWQRLAFTAVDYSVIALVLAGFFNYTGSSDFIQGAMAGLQMAGVLGLTALGLAQAHSPRPWTWLLVHGTPLVLASALMGGVLAAWR